MWTLRRNTFSGCIYAVHSGVAAADAAAKAVRSSEDANSAVGGADYALLIFVLVGEQFE
jgi:hypothetical protein